MIRDDKTREASEEIITEPIGATQERCLFVKRSLNSVRKDGLINVLAVNTSAQPIFLNKGMKTVSIDTTAVCNVNFCGAEVDEGAGELLPLSAGDFDVEQIPPHEKGPLLELLLSFRDIFACNLKELGLTDIVRHEIKLNSSNPVRSGPYRTPLALKAEMKWQIDELLDAGIIEPTASPFANLAILVR